MRESGRAAAVAAAIFLTFSVVAAGAASPATDENPAAPQTAETGGVVSTTAWVNALVAEGMADSPTFAGIVSQLLASNVVATVEPAVQMKPGLCGYTVFVTRTNKRRYIRIYFEPKLQRFQAISIIGHELRHALEIAGHPEVVNQATLRAMYEAVGHGQGDRWDSDGAVQAGHTILHELISPANAVAVEDR